MSASMHFVFVDVFISVFAGGGGVFLFFVLIVERVSVFGKRSRRNVLLLDVKPSLV